MATNDTLKEPKKLDVFVQAGATALPEIAALQDRRNVLLLLPDVPHQSFWADPEGDEAAAEFWDRALKEVDQACSRWAPAAVARAPGLGLTEDRVFANEAGGRALGALQTSVDELREVRASLGRSAAAARTAARRAEEEAGQARAEGEAAARQVSAWAAAVDDKDFMARNPHLRSHFIAFFGRWVDVRLHSMLRLARDAGTQSEAQAAAAASLPFRDREARSRNLARGGNVRDDLLALQLGVVAQRSPGLVDFYRRAFVEAYDGLEVRAASALVHAGTRDTFLNRLIDTIDLVRTGLDMELHHARHRMKDGGAEREAALQPLCDVYRRLVACLNFAGPYLARGSPTPPGVRAELAEIEEALTAAVPPPSKQ